MNPQIENNPAWKPYLKAVKKAGDEEDLLAFIHAHPRRLWVVVALALSLAHWQMIMSDPYTHGLCGCCALHGYTCDDCALHGDRWLACIDGTNAEVYARILEIYTSHFNALPARDRQRVGG
jgi:hypothetical protein